MNLFSNLQRNELVEPRHYTGQDAEEYLDGFRTAYPLIGQPEYPIHKSEAYKHGLRVGKHLTLKHGLPGVPYEDAEMED